MANIEFLKARESSESKEKKIVDAELGKLEASVNSRIEISEKTAEEKTNLLEEKAIEESKKAITKEVLADFTKALWITDKIENTDELLENPVFQSKAETAYRRAIRIGNWDQALLAKQRNDKNIPVNYWGWMANLRAKENFTTPNQQKALNKWIEIVSNMA